jgi:hypothetical protein
LCPKSNLCEPQLPFTQAHGNPGIPPHWKPEIKHNALSRALRSPSSEHVNYNNVGLIEFEVGEEAFEVEDEGFRVEWGIEAEGD